MKAVLFAEKALRFIDKPVPEPGENEALLQTLMAGICNTDVELFQGYYDFEGIPGHELVGVVVRCPASSEWIGRRVVADINCGCGRCPRCLTGDVRHCTGRKTIGLGGRDGAFAQYLTVPLSNLHPVDETVENHRAVFAEPLAAALEIGEQVHITARSRIAILGDGKIGLLAAMALRCKTHRVTVFGKHSEKLRIAADLGLGTVRVDSLGGGPWRAARTHGFDLVVEATGKADGVALALELVRPEGTVVLKTTTHAPALLDLSRVVVDELHLVGSRCGDLGFALHYLKNRWVAVEPLIEAVYRFEDFEAAFERARTPGAKKVLITFATQDLA